jgi:predicted negative regulator of RcsB-dependent stress response
MAENAGGNRMLVVVVVVLAAVAAVLAYMWWQEEESNEFEIEIGSADADAAVERGGTLSDAPPSGLVFRRS